MPQSLPVLAPDIPVRLEQGIEAMGLVVPAQQQHQLLHYLQLLLKWNAAYNLSGIRDPAAMVTLHLLDSLSLLPFVAPGQHVLDVGTGAGLPGIPLAICRPDSRFTLLDSNGKKTRFLFQALTALGLKNVQVVNMRIENFQSPEQIDIVVTRAFASLKKTLDWMGPLLSPGRKLLAMKGQFPASELDELPQAFRLAAVHPVMLPGEDCQRQLLEVVRADPSAAITSA